MQTPFFGPSYVSGFPNLAYQRCINLYPEVVETKSGKAIGAFFSTPGLDLAVVFGPGPIRGMYVLEGNLYVVAGNEFYVLSTSYFVTYLGTIGTSSGPVSIIGNRIGNLTQIAFFDGVAGWYSTNSGSGGMVGGIIALSIPFQPLGGGPVIAVYEETFALVNQSGTNIWYQSNPGDLSTWQALNYTSADALPDSIVSMVSFHLEIWLMKETNCEIWVDAGNSGFSFQRLDGPFVETGCAAPFSVAKGGELLFWLSANSQGTGGAVMASNYDPHVISTQPLIELWQSYPTVADAIGWCYQQAGHLFYVLTFPSGNATWVYDVTTSQLLGIPCWHQRGALNGDGLTFSRHWGNCFAFFNGQSLVGDYRNGNIYIQDLTNQTDYGTGRRWVRGWRALQKPTFDPVKFSALQIDMTTGINVASGTNPQVLLTWSDDGGYTFTPPLYASAGQLGQTAQRVKFNHLGSTRRNSGLDRIFELSSTSLFGVCLIGADLT